MINWLLNKLFGKTKTMSDKSEGGYIGYQKMMGLDTSKADQVPHYNFNYEGGPDADIFDGYGTLYYDELTKQGFKLDFYMWSGSGLALTYIKAKLTEAGFEVANLLNYHHSGNGHFSVLPHVKEVKS